MKTKSFFSAGRLAVLALACIATFCITSCSNDDDSAKNENTILGTWVSLNGKGYTWKYSFGRGTGMFESSNGVSANFNYTTSGGYDAPSGSIHFQFVYYIDGTVYRTESSGTYRVFGKDTLRLSTDGIDSELYIRQKFN